ncbi:MAG: hypothetical protein KJO23_04305 [Bacteroidia bacterium]|nr:hypothetical protein [Bacteroidia bacterium]
MRTTLKCIAVMGMALLLTPINLYAQEAAPARPEYITVTTMYWNMDYENFDMQEWIAVEKEFMDKVTRKNEFVTNASFYMHRFTPDNRELIYVQTYPNWEAIDKATARGNELAELAWPDKTARDAFFDKQAAYYDNYHSDEIYATMSGAKVMTAPPGDDMILYVRKSHFAFPKDGTQKEFGELRDEFTKNVLHKNQYIHGYYPNVHAWGSDRTEFVEAFMLKTMGDFPNMFNRTEELVKAHWPDATARDAMNKKMGSYFTGVHGDYIYTLVEELMK